MDEALSLHSTSSLIFDEEEVAVTARHVKGKRSSFGRNVMAMAGVNLDDYSVSPVKSASSFGGRRGRRGSRDVDLFVQQAVGGEVAEFDFNGKNGDFGFADGEARGEGVVVAVERDLESGFR
ncbi:hypothetical protein HDV00_008452 [Rhizophlyctis rosea]|nr:hypothetical protein HDV00_008452 [Rhizophlyctis rosea]